MLGVGGGSKSKSARSVQLFDLVRGQGLGLGRVGIDELIAGAPGASSPSPGHTFYTLSKKNGHIYF